MKLVSWNVNGIRAVLKKGFLDYLRAESPDILCVQETKAWPEQVELELPGYQQFWDSAQKKGYSGTAVFSRRQPQRVRYGLGQPQHDAEGRVITLTFPGFHLVNVYTPNARRDLERLDYRTQEWDVDFLNYLKELESEKPVVFCGDLNVAHKEIDLANPKSNEKNAGFTPQERRSFDNLVEAGFVDTFRMFTAEGGHYTWWSMMGRAREKNIGWRLDYFCVSQSIKRHVRTSQIQPQVTGSDHCPIVMHLEGLEK
ncbi:MAG: exodeoxyribonuclease III [Candidatus Lambdaproteobacteria bacterium]|nr:exodeoxyribonuclease III [Candidatus Lambdaproteobacteria bacterium]